MELPALKARFEGNLGTLHHATVGTAAVRESHLKGVIDTAFDEGKMEVAKAMKSKGLPIRDISELTGLSENEINKLQD